MALSINCIIAYKANHKFFVFYITCQSSLYARFFHAELVIDPLLLLHPVIDDSWGTAQVLQCLLGSISLQNRAEVIA